VYFKFNINSGNKKYKSHACPTPKRYIFYSEELLDCGNIILTDTQCL